MPYHKLLIILAAILLSVSIIHSPTSRKARTDVLIIAPHPDDAVLCCAGLIQQSLARGKSVRVVNITDGTGFIEAAAIYMNKTSDTITPDSLQRFGKIRQREELHALHRLGLPRKNVSFLSYPDGWLMEVYTNENTTPFTDPHTRLTKTRANNPFTKTAIASDMSSFLTLMKPQEVYVTGMADTALDHQIAYRVVMDAINKAGYTGKLFTYAIHIPDSTPLTIPTLRIQLSQHEQKIKARAINAYRTQTAVDGTFLGSFLSGEELFY